MQVKNKAAVNAPWLYLYVQPSLCQGHWCTPTPMATLSTVGLLVYTYSVGLSLVARFYRIRRFSGATERETSDSAGLHAFFFVFIVLIYNTLGCRSPRPEKEKSSLGIGNDATRSECEAN